MENISWTDRVRNEEVLRRVKDEKKILQIINGRKGYWIGRILRMTCLLNRITEAKIEGRIKVT